MVIYYIAHLLLAGTGAGAAEAYSITIEHEKERKGKEKKRVVYQCGDENTSEISNDGRGRADASAVFRVEKLKEARALLLLLLLPAISPNE